MSGDLKIVAQYGTPEEAHLLRNRLEAAGIRAFLENETTAAWAWHFSNALGGVKILVAEEDLLAAQEVLAPDDAQPAASSLVQAEDGLPRVQPPDSWRCPRCRAEVDAGMDVCWACGASADGSVTWAAEEEAGPEAETSEPPPPPPEVAFVTILFPPTFAYFLFTKLCHLLAPLVPDAKHHPPADAILAPAHGETELEVEALPWEEPGAASEQELDALVRRAWQAALMGFFLLPPVLMTLYSTWLLVQYWFDRRRPNRRRDRLALWTLGLNLLAALCLGLLLSVMTASLFDHIWREPNTIGPPKGRELPYLGH